MKMPKFKGFMKKAKSWFHRNKASILTGGAAAGVVIEGVLASKAGAKTQKEISSVEASENRDLSTKEKIGIVAKNHIAPIAVGAATIGMIFGSDATHRKTIGALSGAYALAMQKYGALKDSVGEKLPEEESKKIFQDAMVAEYDGPKAIPDGKELFYEDHIGYFMSTGEAVYKALAGLNRSLRENELALFAEFAMEAAHINIDDISPMWWTSGWSYEIMEAAWVTDFGIDLVEETINLDEVEPGLSCRYIRFAPGVYEEVCGPEGDLIYYVTSQ